MGALSRIDRILAALEKALVVVLFSALILSLAVNIVSRNLFDRSFAQILELAPAMVLWLAMLGSTLALRENRHIRLEILLRFCPPRVARITRIATGVFGMGVMAVLGWAAVGFVQNEVAIFGPGGWLSAIFPVFFAIALFRFFMSALNPGIEPSNS